MVVVSMVVVVVAGRLDESPEHAPSAAVRRTVRMPARQESSVVLPHPLGPRRSASEPSGMRRLNPSTGRTT